MFGLGKNNSPPGIRRNAAWNCAGTLSDALIGFFMMPFVVHTLGDTTYGLWALIASLTGCFGFLDLGVRGALGRQLAFHLARRDTHKINATLNTAIALLSAAFALTLLGVVALQFLFFRLFDVPPGQEWTVRVTLLLAGLNLALSFPLSAFDATLWAAQRFDRLNQIDICVSVLKAVLIFLFLKSPTTLICLPVISLAGSLLAGSLKMANTWAALGGLHVGVRFISREALGDIFGFGLWNFIRSLAVQIITRIPAVVIGAFVGPAAVTPYAIADKLLNVVNVLFSAATGVLTPKSTATRPWTILRGSGRFSFRVAGCAGRWPCSPRWECVFSAIRLLRPGLARNTLKRRFTWRLSRWVPSSRSPSQLHRVCCLGLPGTSSWR